MQRQAFYLDAPGGGRFCLVTSPPEAPVGGVLYVPPFAEELNKSRRMAALGARALAQRGWLVVQIDLFGCGDSAGEFGQASWAVWLDDLSRAWRLLSTKCEGPLVLWTLRAGGLLAADWLAMCEGLNPNLLMWQGVTSGKQHLAQFLRVKAAGEMLIGSDAKVVMADLRGELMAGRPVEIAGYELSPAVANGLDASTLTLPSNYRGAVGVFEVSGADHAEASPALRSIEERFRGRGVEADIGVVSGPAFWQTQEIETAPALIECSVRWMDRLVL